MICNIVTSVGCKALQSYKVTCYCNQIFFGIAETTLCCKKFSYKHIVTCDEKKFSSYLLNTSDVHFSNFALCCQLLLCASSSG